MSVPTVVVSWTANQPFLTVIVPVYNEEATVDHLLRSLVEGPYPFPEKQVIVVDDGSTDGTPIILNAWRGVPGVLCMRHSHNRGKGAAVRTGLGVARGDVTIIQDADLEYDPQDIPNLVEIIRRGESQVVFGSRYLSARARQPWSRFRVGVVVLNAIVAILYWRKLTDEATCYKAFRSEVLRAMNLECQGFEFCAEATAKTCRLGLSIVEVPISYRGRSVRDGKKIRWYDAWKAILTLIRWRFGKFGRPSISSAQSLALPIATKS